MYSCVCARARVCVRACEYEGMSVRACVRVFVRVRACLRVRACVCAARLQSPKKDSCRAEQQFCVRALFRFKRNLVPHHLPCAHPRLKF
jgi:hypothetical protein